MAVRSRRTAASFGSPSAALLLPMVKKSLVYHGVGPGLGSHARLETFRHEDAQLLYDLNPDDEDALLGTGATSRVSLAWTRQSTRAGPPGTRVAIKQIPRSQRRIAFNELQLLQECACQHVPTIYDAIAHGQHLLLVMQALDGEDLYAHMKRAARRGFLTEPYVRELARQMATILAWLHRRQRVIHRDVKLENFMVTSRSDGGVLLRLIDFGYASPVSQPREQGFGTESYIAPEIPASPEELAEWKASGRWQPYTAAVDIWALGCSVVAMLAGELPFQSDITRELRRSGDFVPPDTGCHRYSPMAHSAVRALLQLRPDARPTADVFLQHPWFACAPVELRPDKLLVTRWASAGN